MTQPRSGHPLTVAAWVLVAALAVAGTVGVVGGILSPSLVVDLVALWPLGVIALLAGVLARMIRRHRRSGAVLPLALFSALVLAAALHLGGWEQLPSGAIALVGPEPTALSDPTELIVQISGDLEIGAGASAAYRIEPIPRGGQVGVPEATETSVDEAVSVTVTAAPHSPSWYRFSGWSITLNPEVHWDLVLNGRLDADFSSLTVSSAAMAGSGQVRFGPPPEGGSTVIVAGDFDVIVPSDASVIVTGDATVPSDWDQVGESVHSPDADRDNSWRISVQGDAIPNIREG